MAAVGVDGGEHGDGLGDGEAGVGESWQQLFGVRAANGDRLDVAQRRDEPVGADRAFSTSVTAHPAATRAWVIDCSQMAEPSSRFMSTSP